MKKQFVYADGVNSPEYMIFDGKRYFFVKDHRGSINLVVNVDSGEVVQRMSYSEFGEVVEDTNPGFQPFGFAGGLYDTDTKLVKFGARDYDGRIGRWLSKDPIRFNGGDSNLYGYVLNDPINFVDSNGRNPDFVNTIDMGNSGASDESDADQAAGAVGDFVDNYNKMRNRDGGDKFRHCMANCQATSRGEIGGEVAQMISNTREYVDEKIKGDSSGDCEADQRANLRGQMAGAGGDNCAAVCAGVQ
jgi:RHS repeat-associated protein